MNWINLFLIANLCIQFGSAQNPIELKQKNNTTVEIIGHDSQVEYPKLAEALDICGFTDILFTIDSNGIAGNFSIIKEEPKGFKFAENAIRQISSKKYKVNNSENKNTLVKVRRHFNFNTSENSSRSNLDTLTFTYKDNAGLRYIIKTERDTARIFIIYNSTGELIEAGKFRGLDSVKYLYVKDSSTVSYLYHPTSFDFRDASCKDKVGNCNRDSSSIKLDVMKYKPEFVKLFEKYFGHLDLNNKQAKGREIKSIIKISPNGLAERVYLLQSKSRNILYTAEYLERVSRIQFGKLSGSRDQFIAF